MPVKRRVAKKRVELEEGALRWLEGHDQGCGLFPYVHSEDELTQIWAEHGDDVVAAHVAEFPGTRPRRWWQSNAPRSPIGTYPGMYFDGRLPEPRRRLGGIGTPLFEISAYEPQFEFGLPVGWPTQSDVDGIQDSGSRINGEPVARVCIGKVPGAAVIDPNDPPVFESEAAYLDRHGLFLPGERRRLRAEDFEPEILAMERDDE